MGRVLLLASLFILKWRKIKPELSFDFHLVEVRSLGTLFALCLETNLILMPRLTSSAGFRRSRVSELPGGASWAVLCVSIVCWWQSLATNVPISIRARPNVECDLCPGSNLVPSLSSVQSLNDGSGSTPVHFHQSAAKDLTASTEPTSASASSSSSLLNRPANLTPASQQRSKRPRNFLELKNFKDNYNTLESSFWNPGPPEGICPQLECLWVVTGHQRVPAWKNWDWDLSYSKSTQRS